MLPCGRANVAKDPTECSLPMYSAIPAMQAEACRQLVKLRTSAVASVEVMIPPRTALTDAPAAVWCDQAVSSVLHLQTSGQAWADGGSVKRELGLDMPAKGLAFHNETEISPSLPGRRHTQRWIRRLRQSPRFTSSFEILYWKQLGHSSSDGCKHVPILMTRCRERAVK